MSPPAQEDQAFPDSLFTANPAFPPDPDPLDGAGGAATAVEREVTTAFAGDTLVATEVGIGVITEV
jgi:hypothetical protein